MLPYACLSLIFITFRLFGKNVSRDVFRSVEDNIVETGADPEGGIVGGRHRGRHNATNPKEPYQLSIISW